MGGRKSDKKYTNEAFTKRVDHEAGRHRTARASAEPLVCEICGDVYARRRWSQPSASKAKPKKTVAESGTAGVEKKSPVSAAQHVMTKVVCPACLRQREGVPSGFLHLEGAFLTEHREEIERLLNNEAERAAEDNPMARLMKWGKDEKGRLMLTTTTEHLVQRLGRALHRAFKGEVRYDFSHENKLAHVYWNRD